MKEKQVDRDILRIINIILLLILSIATTALGFVIFPNNILAFRYIDIALMSFLTLILLLSGYLIIRNKGKKITLFLLILGMVINGVTFLVAREFLNITKTINIQSQFNEFELAVYVNSDSEINDITGIDELYANENIEQLAELLGEIKENYGKEITIVNTESYLSAYENLIAGKAQAMVLNSTYADLLSSVYENYEARLKKVYSYNIVQEVVKANTEEIEDDAEVFNVYISGIDTYGPITSVSRSDVNIIMTVNRKTKKVLLTTTPRDAYVAIADGGKNQKDKLTHAGIYGVDASIHTLENLYGIKIDYYVRVNFTSFLKLIDSVGGIDIENDQEFTSYHGKFYFPKGQVHLDAERALGFVRERYSLENGDNDRGKNQEKIIEALINKLATRQILLNYNEIINNLQDSVQTNMQLPVIMNLINTQLETGGSYQVTSQAVIGTGSKNLKSYAMPSARLYMVELNEESLNSAKEAMQNVMEGR